MIENLNGKITNYNGDPIDGARISIYKKIGETVSNSDGNYSNIINIEREEYIVIGDKEGYYYNCLEYPINDLLNITMNINDNFVEPPTPENLQVIDYGTGDSLLISWSEIDFHFIAGYNIYRSESLQGIFEKINNNTIVNNNYIDTGLETLKNYYYILEVISSNSSNSYGMLSRTVIAGPVKINPIVEMIDINEHIKKVKVDSTKTNREVQKIFDVESNGWWESQRGDGAWFEVILNEKRNIKGFYFKRVEIGKGILFARLQYWNYNIDSWSNLKKIDYFIGMEYTFKDFLVDGLNTINTDRIRLYVDKAEPLTETQISKIIVYGE